MQIVTLCVNLSQSFRTQANVDPILKIKLEADRMVILNLFATAYHLTIFGYPCVPLSSITHRLSRRARLVCAERKMV